MASDQVSLVMSNSASAKKGPELDRVVDRLKQEQRKVRLLGLILGATFLLLLLSVGANLLESYLMVKQVGAGSATSGFSHFMDKNTGFAATRSLQESTPRTAPCGLTQYDMLGRKFDSPYGPSKLHNFTSMQSVQLTFGPAVVSFQVSGHHWVNHSLMKLYTHTGQTVVISKGRATLVNSVLTFPESKPAADGRRRRLFVGDVVAGAAIDAVGDYVGEQVADAATTTFYNAGVDDAFGQGASRYAGNQVGDYTSDQVSSGIRSYWNYYGR